MISRRVVLAGLGGAALLPGRADAASGLLFGYGLAADYLPFFVAQDKGLFATHGLDVTFTALPNPGAVPAAVQGGSLQVASTTPTSLLQAAAAGLDLVAIMGATRQTSDDKIAALVTRHGVTVKSAADLRGKVVGAAGLNNILSVLLKKWLLDNQVALEDVRLVESSFAQMSDLLKAGQIDAALVVEPFLTRITQQGVGVAVPVFLSNYDDLLFSIVIANGAWASSNKPTIGAFRAASAEGLAYLKAHPEEAQQIGQKWLKVSAFKFPPFDQSLKASDLQAYVPALRQVGLLDADVDVGKLILA